MKNWFNLPVIGMLKHNNSTREILAPYAKSRLQSEFARNSIMKFARNQGFDCDIKDKPLYLPSKIWQRVKQLQQKSQKVDYIYVVAFYWLKTLPEFVFYTKSALMREIIMLNCHQ